MVAPTTTSSSTCVTIESQCACGVVCLKVSCNTPLDAQSAPEAVDCHCPTCRKFHVATFVSYVVLSGTISSPASMDADDMDNDHCRLVIEGRENLSVYRDDSCGQLGPVDRWYCRKCFSKLFTRATTNNYNSTILLNMGPITDESVPSTVLSVWQQHREQWQTSSKSIWTDCRPSVPQPIHPPLQEQVATSVPAQETSPSLVVRGSCACQACSYEIDWTNNSMQTEVHHCYCRLCRQISGGPFQSWMPVLKSQWKWLLTDPTTGETTSIKGTQQKPPASSALLLRRTTAHGQRHCCRHCGSVMTIVYDCQLNHIWPATGGLDDIHDPRLVAWCKAQIHRVVHIGCRYKQGWYALPDDGLEKKHWYDWSFQLQSKLKKFLAGMHSMRLFVVVWQMVQTWMQNYQAAWLLLLKGVVYVPQDYQREQKHQPESITISPLKQEQ